MRSLGMDDRLADYEELMRTVEKIRTIMEASKTEKKEKEKTEEQIKKENLSKLFQETLIDENPLLRELRKRGAEFIQEWDRWNEITKEKGLSSCNISLVGDYKDYRVVKNEENAIIWNSYPPDSFVKIGEWSTDPHQFDLRFVFSPERLQYWEGSGIKQSEKEKVIKNLAGKYFVWFFRTLFIKTLQSGNFSMEETCFDNLRDAWCKAIEADGDNLMVLLPSRNYLTHFEKYKEAFDCSVERNHVVPYREEIPEAECGYLFSPGNIHIFLYAWYDEFTRHGTCSLTLQGYGWTGFHFSHPEHIVRFKCPSDET